MEFRTRPARRAAAAARAGAPARSLPRSAAATMAAIPRSSAGPTDSHELRLREAPSSATAGLPASDLGRERPAGRPSRGRVHAVRKPCRAGSRSPARRDRAGRTTAPRDAAAKGCEGERGAEREPSKSAFACVPSARGGSRSRHHWRRPSRAGCSGCSPLALCDRHGAARQPFGFGSDRETPPPALSFGGVMAIVYTPESLSAHPPLPSPGLHSTGALAAAAARAHLRDALESTGPVFGHECVEPGDADLTPPARGRAARRAHRGGRGVLDEAGRPIPTR
jgi:hypothetical protein